VPKLRGGDVRQILNLYSCYTIGMDLGARSVFETIWTEDAHWLCAEIRLDATGRPAIMDYFDKGPGRAPKVPNPGGQVRLHSQPHLERTDQGARGLSTFVAVRYDVEAISPYFAGYYEDLFRRERGHWRLSSRKMIVTPILQNRTGMDLR
jgi:hypothetical protein